MCCTAFLCGLRNCFILICTLLTVYLICQELFNFFIVKPTITSIEEETLKSVDIPDVVICLEPSFDFGVLKKYGYIKDTYYRGSMDGKSFTGWNGRENETKSSNEILEEALVVKSHFAKNTTFITFAKYKDEYSQFFQAEVKLRSLSLPYGRCLSISPPIVEGNISTLFNTLYLMFNETIFKQYNDITARIYMMGKTNALNIYPDETTMAGDSMEIKMNRRQKYSSAYKTKITRSTHVTGDPLLQCNDYTPNNTYNDCTQNELLASFHKILDGSPPFIGKNPKDTCNERFNLSLEKEKVLENFFRPLYLHDAPFKCKTPCTFDKYTTRFLNNAPKNKLNRCLARHRQ